MTDDDQPQPQDDTAPGAGSADDVAFARLRAADPVHGSTPDLSAVFASVTDATGIDVTQEVILVDELTARRSRRTSRWLQAAAIVAGIAVIGGGGYTLGAVRADTTTSAASPAMSLGNAAGAGDGVGTSSSGAAGTNAGAPAAAPRAMPAGPASKAGGWGFGRTVFESSGLSTAGTTAPAYGFDAVSTYSRATVARVAAVLGVAGTPQQQYGQWAVGPNDGSAATVTLSSDGLTSVSYDDPTRDPWTCMKTGMVQPPTAGDGATASAGSAGADVVPVPQPSSGSCPAIAPAPGAKAAVAEAKGTMSALGVDPAGFEFEHQSDPQVPQVANIAAYQVVDGQRSGLIWSFTVLASGVQSLNGMLAPTVSLGSYHVISPTEAVARLGDPRFGSSFGGVYPMAVDAKAVASAAATSEPAPSDAPTVPATPAAGSPLAWPVEHVTLTSARLGLAVTTLPDGASVLIPTYQLSDADGTTWTVVAVADGDLDFGA